MKHEYVMTKSRKEVPLELNSEDSLTRAKPARSFSYFILAIFGFSFWFFIAVPFASHRESYGWLAAVRTEPFSNAFSVISVTYRPLAQGAGWLGFMILDPSIFPTSVPRQAVLQGFIYGMFVLAWWLIYPTAMQRRLFALVAFVAGGVFFSGYVHMFHIYGIFYVPVMLTLGAVFRLYASNAVDKREVMIGMTSIVLVLWHPFATALFVGCYFGFYLDTFKRRRRSEHVRALIMLIVATAAVIAMVGIFSRADVRVPISSKLVGFLESYRTTEVNAVASVVSLLFTELTVLSMRLLPKVKRATVLLTSVLGVFCFVKGIPIMLLWIGIVLIKLCRLRCWSLFCLVLAASVLPFGAGIGGPVSALFAIIAASYATVLGWTRAEEAVSFVKPSYSMGAMVVLGCVVLLIRAGVAVPVVTRAAGPLLTERERTYQLEKALTWLQHSDYCEDELAFAANAGSPIDSRENVISRWNRPPADIGDVRKFWDTVLRCREADRSGSQVGKAIMTFGGPELTDAKPVFRIGGRYAGNATIWIRTFHR